MKYYLPIFLIVIFGLFVFMLTKDFSDKQQFEYDEKQILEKIEKNDMPEISVENAALLAKLPLECITIKYPYKPGHIHEKEQDAVPHSTKTPVFSGCFDWHSAVHMHWTLIRLLRLFPEIDSKDSIISLLNEQFTKEKVDAEISFFSEKYNQTFERTYGWAWLLRLQSELIISNNETSKKWAETLSPLVKIIRDRTIEYLNKLPKPVREGTHSNTAFSMDHMLKYSRIVRDMELEEALEKRAINFFFNDKKCPTDYEPSGVDFISPCLAEAHLMSSILEKEPYIEWFNDFMENPGSYEFSFILNPPEITDHKDYVIGHLVGLNFQRAWSYRNIANILDENDSRKKLFYILSANHLTAGLDGMDKTGYGGEHWLASFATYALTE